MARPAKLRDTTTNHSHFSNKTFDYFRRVLVLETKGTIRDKAQEANNLVAELVSCQENEKAQYCRMRNNVCLPSNCENNAR